MGIILAIGGGVPVIVERPAYFSDLASAVAEAKSIFAEFFNPPRAPTVFVYDDPRPVPHSGQVKGTCLDRVTYASWIGLQSRQDAISAPLPSEREPVPTPPLPMFSEAEYKAWLDAREASDTDQFFGPVIPDGQYRISCGDDPGTITVRYDLTDDGDTSPDPPAWGPENTPETDTEQLFEWKFKAVPAGLDAAAIKWSDPQGPIYTVPNSQLYPDVPTEIQAIDREEETELITRDRFCGCPVVERPGGYPEPAGVASVGDVFHPFPPLDAGDFWFPAMYWRINGDQSGFDTFDGVNFVPHFLVDLPDLVAEGEIPTGYDRDCEWEYFGSNQWVITGGIVMHRYAENITYKQEVSGDIIVWHRTDDNDTTLANINRISSGTWNPIDIDYRDEYGTVKGYDIFGQITDPPYPLTQRNWHIGATLIPPEGKTDFTRGALVGSSWETEAFVAYVAFRIWGLYGWGDGDNGITWRQSPPVDATFVYNLLARPVLPKVPPAPEPPAPLTTLPIPLFLQTVNFGGSGPPVQPNNQAAELVGKYLDNSALIYFNCATDWREGGHLLTNIVPAGKGLVGFERNTSLPVNVGAVTADPLGVGLFDPVFADATVLHIWYWGEGNAPGGAVGYVQHSDADDGTGGPNPPPGNIYPLYTTPQSVPQ